MSIFIQYYKQMQVILVKFDLLITGNGFDLAFNMKTSYINFYETVKAIYNDNFQKLKYLFGNNYNKNSILNHKGYALLQKYIKEDYKSNYFLSYFLNYHESFNCWNAFEIELLRIIRAWDFILFKLKNEYINFKLLKNDEKIYFELTLDKIELHHLNSFITCFNNELCEFKIDSQNKILLNFKCFKFSLVDNTYLNYYIENEKNNFIKCFIDLLYSELNSFSKIFTLYLNCFSRLTRHKNVLNINCDKVINYNYTNNAETVFGNDIQIFYLNGKYKYSTKKDTVMEWNEDKIVLGVDSSNDFKIKEFSRFTKRNMRIVKDTDIFNLSQALSEANTIAVIGHSLSESDYDSLSYIFKYKKYDSIIIYYYDDYSKISLVENLSSIFLDELDELINSGSIKLININSIIGKSRKEDVI